MKYLKKSQLDQTLVVYFSLFSVLVCHLMCCVGWETDSSDEAEAGDKVTNWKDSLTALSIVA